MVVTTDLVGKMNYNSYKTPTNNKQGRQDGSHCIYSDQSESLLSIVGSAMVMIRWIGTLTNCESSGDTEYLNDACYHVHDT